MQKYRPSTGSEGADFIDTWCANCKRDAAFQADPETGDSCPIVANTFCFELDDPEYPAEWQYGTDGVPRCTAFDPVVKP